MNSANYRWQLINKQIKGELTDKETKDLEKMNKEINKKGMNHTDKKVVLCNSGEESYYD